MCKVAFVNALRNVTRLGSMIPAAAFARLCMNKGPMFNTRDADDASGSHAPRQAPAMEYERRVRRRRRAYNEQAAWRLALTRVKAHRSIRLYRKRLAFTLQHLWRQVHGPYLSDEVKAKWTRIPRHMLIRDSGLVHRARDSLRRAQGTNRIPVAARPIGLRTQSRPL